MDTLLRHRQVVLLICGLMPDPTPIICLVFEHWIADGPKSEVKTLIEPMFHEAQLPVPKNLLHNEWINYYDHDDTTPIYVPSRLYEFNEMKAKVSCNIHHGHTEIPECSMSMSLFFPNEAMSKSILSICHRICQHQAVRDLDMYQVQCEDLPEPCVFNISRNTESMTIIFCTLPTQTLSHVIQQINGCSSLRVLHLYGTNLTGLLSCFLRDPHPGLPQLEKLKLGNTALNKEDLQHLSNITQSNKLPKLQELDLSWNILTGCLSSLLLHHNPVLPELKKLNLHSSRINKEDLQNLTHLIQTHKLPGLERLNLQWNRLSEMETDVGHLIEACVTHHQRKLDLNLQNNNLSEAFENKWKKRCAGTYITLWF